MSLKLKLFDSEQVYFLSGEMVLFKNKQERRNQSQEGIGLVSKDLDSLLQDPNLIYIIYPFA